MSISPAPPVSPSQRATTGQAGSSDMDGDDAFKSLLQEEIETDATSEAAGELDEPPPALETDQAETPAAVNPSDNLVIATPAATAQQLPGLFSSMLLAGTLGSTSEPGQAEAATEAANPDELGSTGVAGPSAMPMLSGENALAGPGLSSGGTSPAQGQGPHSAHPAPPGMAAAGLTAQSLSAEGLASEGVGEGPLQQPAGVAESSASAVAKEGQAGEATKLPQGSTQQPGASPGAAPGSQIALPETAGAPKADFSALLASQTGESAAPGASPPADVTRPAATPASLQSAPAPTIQVFSRIVERADGRAQRFEMRLDPAELGRVDIRIEIGADRKVHAILAAHDSSALADLMRGQRALERALSDAGIDLADSGVRFELAGDNGNNAARERDGGNGRGTPSNVWRNFDTVSMPTTADVAVSATQPSWRPQRLDLVA